MIKQLIQCPNCESSGRKEILGELGTAGDFSILRFHNSTTVIKGEAFDVRCGKCGELVYRKEANESSNIGKQWVHRETLMGTFTISESFPGTN